MSNGVTVMDSRLSKYMEVLPDIEVIEQANASTVRPNHWIPIIAWLKILRQMCGILNVTSWNQLDVEQKMQMRVVVLSTGRSNSGIHLDYESAESLIGFSTNARSIHAMTSMLDNLSNPVTYGVAQVTRALAEHKVLSKFFATIAWGTKDDLDLAVGLPNGQRVSFSNTIACGWKLDFDANKMCGSNSTTTPTECISYTGLLNMLLKGTYTVYVSCYARYNGSKSDIPYSVIISINGNITEKQDISYASSGQSWVNVHTFTIGDADIQPPAEIGISASKARSIQASSPKFTEHFGTPRAVIQTMGDIDATVVWEYKPVLVSGYSIISGLCSAAFGGGAPVSGGGVSVAPKKTTLSERLAIEAEPASMKFSKFSSDANVTVPYRTAGLPFYATKVIASNGTKMPLHMNTYHVPRQLAHDPDRSIGDTARLTPECFDYPVLDQVKVVAIIQYKGNYFLIIEGMQLPSSGWPIRGGFYPTDLFGDLHCVRTEYSLFDSIAPSPPTSSGRPLIGVWLANDTNLMVDGKSIMFKVRE